MSRQDKSQATYQLKLSTTTVLAWCLLIGFAQAIGFAGYQLIGIARTCGWCCWCWCFDASMFHFYHICLAALVFLLFGNISQVFNVLLSSRIWVQILSCTMYYRYCCCTLTECVACFFLWNWMGVNMNTITLRMTSSDPGQTRGSDPRVRRKQLAGHGRPASDPYIVGHDPTRPVIF